jgi:glucokinase
MAPAHILAVDIGGTKIATAVITSQGEILRTSKASSAAHGPSALIDQIAAMLRDDLGRTGINIADVLGLGAGIAAVISPDHKTVVWAPNLPAWENIPLHDELATRLNVPVRIEYDGHTAVLGEWWLGAGRGYQNVVFLIVGTGIGGGMILNGQLYRGASGLAGAAGWFVLDTQRASDEYARQVGHWESLAAGPGIDRLAAERLHQSGKPSILREQGPDPPEKLTTQTIFDAAQKGDALARDRSPH